MTSFFFVHDQHVCDCLGATCFRFRIPPRTVECKTFCQFLQISLTVLFLLWCMILINEKEEELNRIRMTSCKIYLTNIINKDCVSKFLITIPVWLCTNFVTWNFLHGVLGAKSIQIKNPFAKSDNTLKCHWLIN